jgi:hypothetical protein
MPERKGSRVLLDLTYSPKFAKEESYLQEEVKQVARAKNYFSSPSFGGSARNISIRKQSPLESIVEEEVPVHLV